jgi:peptidyl-prolyl cis-trans isomerase SurA
MSKLSAVSIVLFLLFCASLVAQPQPREGSSLDRIAAIVGDEIIMQSDVDGQLYYMSQYDKTIDVNDKAAKNKILESMIDQLLMVNKAKLDSVQISEEEINQRMEVHLQSEVQRFGSEKRVEQVYGMSLPRIKNDIREKIKQNLLVTNLLQLKFTDLKASQKEVEEFYKDKEDSLPVLPPAIELYHIVKKVKANTGQKKSTYELAKQVRDSILAGGSFADFAKRYSSDPGTVNSGGDLGWFEKGKLFPEFEKAAFNLSTGELSMPVETPYGFHIIQTLEKKTDAINTRHILFKIGQAESDVDEAVNMLKDIKKRVDAGEAFETLAKEQSDDKETRGFGGMIGKLPISDLPESVRLLIDSLKEGGVSDPIPYKNDPSEPSYHIVYIKRYIQEHKANLKDDYREIELMAIEYKKRQLYSNWLVQLRKELYWEIKD